jgi:hypothetical protein
MGARPRRFDIDKHPSSGGGLAFPVLLDVGDQLRLARAGGAGNGQHLAGKNFQASDGLRATVFVPAAQDGYLLQHDSDSPKSIFLMLPI